MNFLCVKLFVDNLLLKFFVFYPIVSDLPVINRLCLEAARLHYLSFCYAVIIENMWQLGSCTKKHTSNLNGMAPHYLQVERILALVFL